MFNWTKIKKSSGSAHLKNWNVAIGQSLWQSRHLYLHQAIVHFYKKLTALLKRRKWSKRGRVLTQLVDARLFCKTKAWIAIEFQRKKSGFFESTGFKKFKRTPPEHNFKFFKPGQWLCGSVGRAVTPDIRGPWFESSHWQKFIYIEHLFTVACVLKRRK